MAARDIGMISIDAVWLFTVPLDTLPGELLIRKQHKTF